MRLRQLFLLLIFLIQHSIQAQTLQPSVICTSGGYSVSGGISLSSTVGETATSTFQNGGILLTQGEQQPYILLKILNLKAFLQGFYMGGSQMQAVLNNNYPLMPATYCDTITVQLRNSTTPFAIAHSQNVILLKDGTSSLQVPSALGNNSYYVVIKHRNSLETWSKTPVSLSSSVVTYNFSTP